MNKYEIKQREDTTIVEAKRMEHQPDTVFFKDADDVVVAVYYPAPGDIIIVHKFRD
jgi:hypothetical protein